MSQLKDVAESAGVSMSVASRVLNRDVKARISDATRKRVFEAASKLDYAPDHRARALRSSRAEAIALVVPEVNNAVFAELYLGVQRFARERSIAVLLGELEAPRVGGKTLDRLVAKGRVDGIILQRSENVDDATLNNLISANSSLVLFNSTLSSRKGSVILDDYLGVKIALEHLFHYGHQKIGFIAGNRFHDASRRRESAFRTLMMGAGASPREDWIIQAGWEAEEGAAAMRTLLLSPDRPSAVLVASVNAAIGALSEGLSVGLRFPEDIALITIHDTWLTRFFSPSISVVKMPLEHAGYLASEMLLGHIDGAPLSDVVVHDPMPELIVRQTTAGGTHGSAA